VTTIKPPQALQDAVLDYLEDLELEQTAAYARGGRSLARMADDELLEAWFEAMQAYASDPTSFAPRIAEATVRAELALRGLEPPWDVVSLALAEIRVKTSKLFESLDHDKLMEIDEQHTANLVDYLRRRTRSHN
jgi:hypothetical protein